MDLKKLFTVFLCISAPISLFAQSSLNILSVDYAQFSSASYKSDQNEEFQTPMNYFTLNGNLPLMRKKHWMLLSGVNYDCFKIENNPDRDDNSFFQSVSTIGCSFKLVKKWNDLSAFADWETKFRSNDLFDFDDEKLIYRGVLGVMKRNLSPTFQMLGLGIGVNSDFGIPTVIPAVFINLKMISKFRYKGVLPLRGKLICELNRKTSFGLQHNARYISYKLTESKEWNAVVYSKVKIYRVGLFIEKEILPHISILVNNGFTVLNKVALFNSAREQMVLLTAKNEYFLNLTLSFKINTNEDK